MDFNAVPRPQEKDKPDSSAQFISPGPPRPNPVFFREDGLRAGWRFFIYLSLALLLYAFGFIPISLLVPARSPFALSSIIAGEVLTFAAAFVTAIWMAKIEGRSVALFGLPFRSAFGKRFWQGMFIGLAEISVIVGCLKIAGAYSFGAMAFHGLKILEWAALWLIAAILIALSEEFLFRGYTQFTLADGVGFWPAAVTLSLLFALIHKANPGENWIGVANIFCTGLVWAFALRRTGSLWLPVGWHAAFDFGESFLYSVPDSGGMFEGHLSNATLSHSPVWLTGGDVGPEASLLAFVTIGMGALLIHFWFPAPKLNPPKAEESAEI